MEIEFSANFRKRYLKANVRVRNRVNELLKIFKNNPNDPQLNNHKLTKEWERHRSIDVTSDWRAIYKEVLIDEDIISNFVDIGTHQELYGK